MANTSFSELKKSRQTQLDKLTQEFQKVSTPQQNANTGKDERLWEPSVDKAGNGYAIIRFLPAPKGEDIPFVRVFSHGFQSKETGSWYIENCLTSLGQKCPCCEVNNKLWNSGLESDKNVARDQKRKLSFYSNILIVKDPNNPDNEGKVFLFRYGKKIFDKIMESMQPEFEDETPINPFDFWQGANFKLKIVKKDGYWNYDKSEFGSVEPLLDDDDALEALWKKEHSLAAVTAPDQFKSYEELEARLNAVLGLQTTPTRSRAVVEQEDDLDEYTQTPSVQNRVVEELEQSYARSKSPSLPKITQDDEEEDDALSYFQKLAEE